MADGNVTGRAQVRATACVQTVLARDGMRAALRLKVLCNLYSLAYLGH